MNISRYIFFIPIVVISLITGIYLAEIRVFELFLAHDITPVNYPIEKFPIQSELLQSVVKIDEIPGFIYITMILSNITGLYAEHLMFLPIGSLLLPLGYFIIANKQFKYSLIALIIPIYIAVDGGLIIGYYSITKHTLAFFLFFLFLFIYRFKFQLNKYYFIIIIILFIGMSLIHYTIAAMTFLILLIAYIIDRINKTSKITSTFILLLLIIFVVLKIPTFVTYVHLLETTTVSDIIQSVFARIQTYTLQDVESSNNYTTFASTDNTVLLLKAVRALLLLIPIVFYVFLYMLKPLLKQYIKINNLDSLWWAVIITSVTNVLLYISIGSAGIINNFMLVMYPFVAILVLLKMKLPTSLVTVYLIMIVITSGTSLLSELDDIDNSGRYESILHIYKLFPYTAFATHELNLNDYVILGDFKSIGQYILINAHDGILVRPIYMSPNNYDALIGNTDKIYFTYAFLHVDNKPITSVKWNLYEPVNLHVDRINSNNNFSRVYADSSTIILMNNKYR